MFRTKRGEWMVRAELRNDEPTVRYQTVIWRLDDQGCKPLEIRSWGDKPRRGDSLWRSAAPTGLILIRVSQPGVRTPG